MILKTRINTTSLLATLLFIIICITIQIININAGYGEVWQEMNWVYNNEEYFVNEENYHTTDSGLKFALLPIEDNDKTKKNERKTIEKGDKANVMYKLYLQPMTKNDRRRHLYSQANLQRALEITIGAGTVIKGFDEAVSKMKVGDKGRFVLPPHIGYGDAGQPGFQIPSGATLIYYLELIGRTPKKNVYSRYGSSRDRFNTRL